MVVDVDDIYIMREGQRSRYPCKVIFRDFTCGVCISQMTWRSKVSRVKVKSHLDQGQIFSQMLF